MQIDGNTIPDPMASRGRYVPADPPILATNGRNEPVTGGYPSVTWSWDWIDGTDYDFWATTVLGGARSAVLTGTTQLYDTARDLVTYASATVIKPTFERIENGIYYNVTVEIKDLIE